MEELDEDESEEEELPVEDSAAAELDESELLEPSEPPVELDWPDEADSVEVELERLSLR